MRLYSMDDPQLKLRPNKRPFVIIKWMAFLSVGFCIVALYFYLGKYTEADKTAYDKLVTNEDAKDVSEIKISKQLRTGMQKNIFTDKGRLFQMKSATSELSLEKQGRHVAIVEHLCDVTCWLQEGIDLVVLHAADATYHYQGGELVANQVRAKQCVASNPQDKIAEYATFDSCQHHIMAISADYGHYLHGVLTLTGNAQVEQKRGRLSADKIIVPALNHTKNVIEEMTAEGNVAIWDGDQLTLSADRGVFKRTGDAEGILSGTITFSCLSGKECIVTSSGGDEVKSDLIVMDTIKRELLFTSPQGVIRSGSTHPVKFEAQRMVWDDPSSKLRLIGDVKVFQDGCGFKAANDVLLVLASSPEGKKVLRGIETKGEASLTYLDQREGIIGHLLPSEGKEVSSHSSQNEYLLQSHGSLRIDHQKQEIKLRSPEYPDGSVDDGKQVYFKDAKGEIYADKAFLKYSYIEQKMIPVRIVLEGNVKMSTKVRDKKGTQQYVLADRVDFIPQSKEMTLKASKGKRVLLYDEGSSLEVSAPQIKLHRDKAMNKEMVQGIGDVRLHFVENESEQLRSHFSIYEKFAPSKD